MHLINYLSSKPNLLYIALWGWNEREICSYSLYFAIWVCVRLCQ